MKIKSDFVTNSSSSSFIVVFPKKIETFHDVKKYMSEEKANVVFRESLQQTPVKIDLQTDKEDTNLMDIIRSVLLKHVEYYVADEAIEEIKNIIKEDFPEIVVPIAQMEYIILKIKKQFEEHNQSYESFDCSDEELQELIEKNNKGFIYLYKYSDEDGGFWSKMEHGGTFDNLPHIRISHH